MATQKQIINQIDKAIARFAKGIPKAQRAIFNAVQEEAARLDLYDDGRIRPTVKNLSILASIRAKINRVIVTDEYKAEVKKFASTFKEIFNLQTQYWKQVEPKFKPTSLLKEVRKQAITETVSKLTEAGIGVNVGDRVIDILRTNITTGGSYSDLTSQLRDGLLDTEQKGYLDRYARQVTTDSLNQFSAQYNQIVSSDLGMEWYVYDGTDIETTRPFCDAMTDQPYFHISQVPDILKAKNLYFTKDGVEQKVKLNPKSGLPYGMIPGTNAENFFVRRGGYNCGHQIRPVNEMQVPKKVVLEVKATPKYKAWARATK